MKISTFLPAILALATPILGCAHYKTCWCQKNDQIYNGLAHQNIAWDESTVKACREPGQVIYNGKQNWKVCYRYKKRFPSFVPSYSINNCDWNDQCRKNDADAGYCTDKL